MKPPKKSTKWFALGKPIAALLLIATIVGAAWKWPVDDWINWLIRYPLLPIQVVLVLLASWRLIGREVGIERLIWNERVFVQLGAGWAIAMLFGVILFVRYLLGWVPLVDPVENVAFVYDPVTWILESWLHEPPALTIFPSDDIEVRRVGAFLLWGMSALGVLLVAPKFYAATQAKNPKGHSWFGRCWTYVKSRGVFFPGMLGYVAGIGFLHALFRIDESLGLRERLFRLLPNLEKTDVATMPSLQGVATFSILTVTVVLIVFWTAVAILNRIRPAKSFSSPVVFAALLLVWFNLVYGWFAFVGYNAGFVPPTLLVLLTALAFVVWNSPWLFKKNHYSYRFPNLEPEYRDLEENGAGALDPLPPRQEPTLGLIADAEPLQAMHDRWRAAHSGDETKPKIVLFAVSGGGIRSAVWTAIVLEKLEALIPGFRDHIRLFTGASGGMVGATLYVSTFEHQTMSQQQLWKPEPTRGDAKLGLGWLSGTLAEDSLTATIQTAVLRDMGWNLLLPPGIEAKYERGRTLEEKWGLNARQRGLGPQTDTPDTAAKLEKLIAEKHAVSPFARTFADLHPDEKAGLRPSMIFSPMMVEDSRRLLISNLNVDYLAQQTGPMLGSVAPEALYSRPGLEFFGRFPASHDRFQIGTAARMNASFPVISPAVSLPTNPPRRPVDAGYFDNYGLDIAAHWLFHNREKLIEVTGGVAIVQIRAFPLQVRGDGFCPEDPEHGESGGLLSDALSVVSTPLQALLRARGSAAYHRNNELLSALNQSFNALHQPGFLSTVAFELDSDAALNWYISSEEKQDIAEHFADRLYQAEALKKWFGSGGS